MTTVITLLAVSSLTVMSGTAITMALPSMARHFAEVDNAEFLVQLSLTMPALINVVFAPISGWLVDRWGRRPVLLSGLVVFAAAGGTGGLIDSIYAIILLRAVFGMGVAAITTAAITLMGDYFAGHDRNRIMGLQGSFNAIGGIVFLFVGGVLADISWRAPFLIYFAGAPMVFAVAAVIFEPRRYEPSGADARLTEEPVRWSVIALLYGVGFFSLLIFYMVPIYIPFLAEATMDATATQTGTAVAVGSAFVALAAFVHRRLRARYTFLAILAAQFILQGTGHTIMGHADSFVGLYVGLIVGGLGLGLLFPNISLWLLATVPQRVRGRFVGGLTMSMYLGQFFSPIVNRPIVEWQGIGGAFEAAGILMVVGGLLFASVALGTGRIRARE